MKRTIAVLVALLMLVLFVSGCSAAEPETTTPAEQGATPDCGPITVASLLDSEGGVLGNMVLQMLEANGYEVVDKTQLGTPDVVRAALLEGEISATIDYTGSGQFYIEGQEGLDVWNEAESAYATVAKLDKEQNNLVWLQPAPANNTELIAAPTAVLEDNGIVTMEDFAAYVNGGGEVKLIGAQAWMDNPAGLLGFEEAYGFELTDDQLVGLSTGVTAEMLKAAAEGTDGVNFTLAYGTDGQLDDLGLTIIEDPKSVPPVYEPAPVFRGEIIEQCPEIADILDPVFTSLDIEKLQQLNAAVAFEGLAPADVAHDYLVENGFLDE